MYKGSANLTQIYSSVNATNWVLVYRCQNCFLFDDPTQSPFNTSTSKTTSFMQGWAQAFVAPADPKNPQSNFGQHNNGMGEFVIQVASATHVSYSAWATKTVREFNVLDFSGYQNSSLNSSQFSCLFQC